MSDRISAALIANAFLAGPWTPPAMADRARRALGRPPAGWWLRLAEATRSAYPDPPRDRPRELATFVTACLPQVRPAGADLRGRAVHLAPAFTAMGPTPWPVPPLDTVADLAHHLGLTPTTLRSQADVRGWEATAAAEQLRDYRYRWVAKRSGGWRLLEAPKPRLRHVQRVLLRTVLDRVPAHPAAHGFRKGGSPVTNARAHTRSAVVIGMDLADFFTVIGGGRVYGIFRRCGYPEPVAHLLTGLVTNTVPLPLRTPPANAPLPSPGRSERSARRPEAGTPAALGRPHLPQGAPTSPSLANLAAHRLDRRLSGLAVAVGARYTRYADDLTISSSDRLGDGQVGRLTALVSRIAREEGFAVNHAKTRVRRAGQRQRVTGAVVNERTSLARPDYDRLKATLTNAARRGLPEVDGATPAEIRRRLEGQVSWVCQLHPERGRRLREILDRVNGGSG